MAFSGQVVGTIRIRQVYSKGGHNYCAVSMPTAIMDALGWQPGDILQYYPTKQMGMTLIKITSSLQLLPDFNENMLPPGKPLRGPRPGSREARALEVEQDVDEMTASLAKLLKTRGSEPASRKKAPKPKRRR